MDMIQAQLVSYMGGLLSFLTMAPCEVMRAIDQSQLAKTYYQFLVLFMASSKSIPFNYLIEVEVILA